MNRMNTTLLLAGLALIPQALLAQSDGDAPTRWASGPDEVIFAMGGGKVIVLNAADGKPKECLTMPVPESERDHIINKLYTTSEPQMIDEEQVFSLIPSSSVASSAAGVVECSDNMKSLLREIPEQPTADSTGRGDYVVQDRRIEYYTRVDGRESCRRYTNEWGKGRIEAPELFGSRLFFHQDGNAYAWNGDKATAFKDGYIAGIPGAKRVFAISPLQGISAVDVDSGETAWTLGISTMLPSHLGHVKYRQAEVRDVLLTRDVIVLDVQRQPEQSVMPIHDKAGRIVDYERNPNLLRRIVVSVDDGAISATTAGLNKLSEDAPLRFVGYSGPARYYPDGYWQPSDDGTFSAPPQNYADMLWDGQQIYEYIDVKTGRKITPDLPANPNYVDGRLAFVWNENTETLYAYRLPDWTRDKEAWRSPETSWKCPN